MLYRFVWADGELALANGYTKVHHRDLLKQLIDEGKISVPVQNYVGGDFSTSDFHGPAFDKLDVVWESGVYPSTDELRYIIQNELGRFGREAHYARIVDAYRMALFDDNIWYHATDIKSLPGIAKRGLQPGSGQNWGKYVVGEAVYLWPTASLAYSYINILQERTPIQKACFLRIHNLDRNRMGVDHETLTAYLVEHLDPTSTFEPDFAQRLVDASPSLTKNVDSFKEFYSSNINVNIVHRIVLQALQEFPLDVRSELVRLASDGDLTGMVEPVMYFAPIHPDYIEVAKANILDDEAYEELWESFLSDRGLQHLPDDQEEEVRDEFYEWVNEQDEWIDVDDLNDEVREYALEDTTDNNANAFRYTPIQQKYPINNPQLNLLTAADVEDTEPAGKDVGFMRAPHKVLYPNLFMGTDKIPDEYGKKIKRHVLDSIESEFKNPDDFIYFTIYGDGLSYNWSEGGDLDVQMWVDIEKYNSSGNDDKIIDDLIADIRRLVQLVNFPSFAELGLKANNDEVEPTTGSMLIQYYPKPGTGSKDENLASNPYACYDLETNKWLHHPKPITPLDYVDNFKQLMPKAKDIAMQTESLLGEYQRNILNWQFWYAMYQRYNEPYFKEQFTESMKDAAQQKEGIKNLFEGVFGGRAEAYAPGGSGIYDPRDNLQKLLEVWGIFQELKHYARAPLPWEEQELPSPDDTGSNDNDNGQEATNDETNRETNHGRIISGWVRSVNSALQGLPEKAIGPNPDLQNAAADYMNSVGLPYDPPQTYQPVDPERAKAIAQEYDQMQHSPNDPETKAAYDALIKETLAQYNHLVKNGYNFEFYPQGQDPYPSGPREAVQDVHQNKHLYVYPTNEGFGTETDAENDHPLLQDSGVKWNGQPVTYNDIFRAVHDVYGHAKEGVGFRADGEENAWRQHSAMYSPLARKALTAETRGQNSWVNFGPHGMHNQNANQADTIYADQKAGLLPDWVVNQGAHDSEFKVPAGGFGSFSKSAGAYDDVVEDILAHGGGTYDSGDFDPAGSTYGYYCSVEGGVAVPISEFNSDTLEQFVRYMTTDLLGAWVYDGDVYLDSTKWFANKEEALEFGRINHQKAIWDIANNEEIFVDPHEAGWRLAGAEDSPEHRDPGGWPGIMEKAQRLRDNGQVQITNNLSNHVTGVVQGDHGTYNTEIWRDDPNSGSISLWNCDCPWSGFSWGRTRQWKKYEGRPCAHTLALYWTSLGTPVDDENQMTIPGTDRGIPQMPQTPNDVDLPAALQQTRQPQPTPSSQPQPANEAQQMTIGFPGAFSKVDPRWHKEGQFNNGDYVRANQTTEGYDDRGSFYTVPRNKIGEVIWSDDEETIVIFSLESGPLGPHNVRVTAPTQSFSLVPRQRGTAPRRRR